KEKRGKGYGDEALKLLITYCNDSLKVNRLFCNIEGKNEVSMKLFLNNGFKLVKQDDDWFGDDTFLNDENVSQLVR
ncbi:MAG: GNAT family N-acetyltransferase, partial [Bacteroidetes bacterium]|nr:GNAT family N-acetyltransferase [Bacteroidota bacterium]